MSYLRCTSCGSKALSAASQCPRCAEPFDLIDGRGIRAPLKQCSGCGIMHRRDRACHWCGDRVPTNWRSARSLGVAAGLVCMALGSVGAYTFRDSIRDGLTMVATRAFAPGAASVSTVRLTDTPTRATTSEPASPGIVSAAVTPETLPVVDSLKSATMLASVADSIVWIPAVARTWVNVRNDASRVGNVVGVINPSARAMLGTTRAGWRQVKSPDVSGWVDPKLFERDSTRSRGL